MADGQINGRSEGLSTSNVVINSSAYRFISVLANEHYSNKHSTIQEKQ